MKPLKEKIEEDLKTALKSRDGFRVGTLRLASSALHNRSIEKKGKGLGSVLTEEETIEVLSRELKRRKEAAVLYERGGRSELALKEKQEAKILEEYLPEELSPEEVEKIVDDIIARAGAVSLKNFGRIMGEAMKRLKGRTDAALVGELIKKKLG